MTDIGILMTAPMVKASLDGRKTQTRRLAWKVKGVCPECDGQGLDAIHCQTCEGAGWIRKPTVWQKAQPGDRLWVREAFVPWDAGVNPNVMTRADMALTDLKTGYRSLDYKCYGPWSPSTHMPRSLSRLTLVVTEVRRQRLQEISEEDALAEGIYRQDPSPEEIAAGDCTEDDFVFLAPGTRQGYGPRPDDPQWGPTAAFAYRCLWDSLHGKGTWDENPEVVALTFTVHLANIDQLGEAA